MTLFWLMWVGLVLGGLIASLWYQERLWHRAAVLARSAIEQVAPVSPPAAGVYVMNLPYYCAEGPVILKDYAFQFYSGRGVSARAVVVGCDPSSTSVVVRPAPEGWTDKGEGQIQIALADPVPRR